MDLCLLFHRYAYYATAVGHYKCYTLVMHMKLLPLQHLMHSPDLSDDCHVSYAVYPLSVVMCTVVYGGD